MMKILNRSKKTMNNHNGFTLIELIVVIVIVGILAAILIPRFTGFTEKAQKTQALVYAKQVATAYDAVATEDGAYDDADSTEVLNLAGVDATVASVVFDSTDDGGFVVTTSPGSFKAGRDTSSSAIEYK